MKRQSSDTSKSRKSTVGSGDNENNGGEPKGQFCWSFKDMFSLHWWLGQKDRVKPDYATSFYSELYLTGMEETLEGLGLYEQRNSSRNLRRWVCQGFGVDCSEKRLDMKWKVKQIFAY